MKNKSFLKVIAVLLITVMAVFTLASCSVGGASAAKNDDGEHGNFTWKYTKSDKTLEITGSGAMDNFEGASDVAWKSVASSVETVKFIGNVTNIPDYAFYAMPKLKNIVLPESVTSIGKMAFAFTSELTSINIPGSVTTIGADAFRYSGITAIELHAVTVIDEGTFAYSGLTQFVGHGVTDIKKNAFASCKGFEKFEVADTAAIEAKAAEIFGDKTPVPTISKAGENFTVTVKYVYDSGEAAGESVVKLYTGGTTFTLPEIPAKEGYTAAADAQSFVVDADKTVTVTYTKIPEETEAPVETESTPVEEPKDETPDFWKYAAVIGTVVILAGVAVAVILYVRHDKKKTAPKNGKSNKTAKK